MCCPSYYSVRIDRTTEMSYPTEKFCLKWNDFQNNIVSSLQDLGNNKHFSDVTLVCEEDHQIDVHKVILAACSPLFRTLLKKNNHSHPMIYMRGLKARDLTAVVDFIYHGEANIYQEDLDGFLLLAEELQLKGLAGSQGAEDIKYETEQNTTQLSTPKVLMRENTSQKHNTNLISNYAKYEDCFDATPKNYPVENSVVPVLTQEAIVHFKSNLEDLKAKIDSMMERDVAGEKAWKCKMCGRETKHRTDMTRHVETHIEGVSYPCNQCDAFKWSSNSLHAHVSRAHRK